jgi:hypothetical protein
MKGRGEKAFAVFERQVCFYTAFHDDSFARIGKPNQLTGRSVGIYSSSIKNLFKSTSVGKITLYFKKLHTKLIDTTESIEFNTNAVLYSYKDSVVSINLVCSFLKYSVIFPTDFDLKRFLIDDEYIPTNLPDNWDDEINFLLKKLKGRGEKAFAVFERQVCFYTYLVALKFFFCATHLLQVPFQAYTTNLEALLRPLQT